MVKGLIVIAFLVAAAASPAAQWELQPSGTSAGLRGIHSVNGSIAWASGTEGTVLRTIDSGLHWQRCATPSEAGKLDFRAVWAWDANTAVVLSAGPGEQSRIYRTTDACAHWTEERKNTEKDGFWDALVFEAGDLGKGGGQRAGLLLGDPARGRFYIETTDGAHGWSLEDGCAAREGEGAFAASNSSVVLFGPGRYILVTGGKSGARALLSPLLADAKPVLTDAKPAHAGSNASSNKDCLSVPLPLAGGSDSAGAFSVAFRDRKHGVVVGGDYKKPDESSGTAAWTSDGGHHWTVASKPPHGYRSAIVWDANQRLWIAAGPSGSDLSHDDGKTWQHLDDGNWNAISLPYVVGAKGRIGKLRADSF